VISGVPANANAPASSQGGDPCLPPGGAPSDAPPPPGALPEGYTDSTVLLSEIRSDGVERIVTSTFWDRIFGGESKPGIAVTSLTLLGGGPGAGKSTSALQLADMIAKARPDGEVLYILAEQANEEVREYAARLNLERLTQIRIFPMGSTDDLATVLTARRPVAVFLDSLSKFCSGPDEAVDLCTAMKPHAVLLRAPFVVIDHVTKSGEYAGLKALEHEVDTTIMITETGQGELREIEVDKNRFGPAHVPVTVLMTEHHGLLGLSEEEIQKYAEEHRSGDGEDDESGEDGEDEERRSR
jgi:DNA repair protein RadA/Sms